MGEAYEAAVEIREAINDLTGAVRQQMETKPTIRVRLQHTHTLKDGWRLSETTVEYSGERIDWDKVGLAMANAYDEGTREARNRNAAEAAS